jgi:hypothetical protein
MDAAARLEPGQQRGNEESMTGLERLIAKVSNATAAAMRGDASAVVTVESWSLDELRRSALEDLNIQERRRRFEDGRRQWRRMVHFGCE